VFYNVCCAFFYAGNLQKANEYIQELINTKSSRLRLDIQSSARILNVIIQYDMKKYDLVEYKIKNIKKYLKRGDALFQFEKMLFKTLRKAINTNSSEETSILFKELGAEIIRLKKENSIESRMLDSFHYSEWAQSKTLNISLAKALLKSS